jgi:hypothetical protein
MACPDASVELMRAQAAAVPTAAHAAEGPPPITSTSVARASVSPRLRWRATGQRSHAGNGLQRLGCPVGIIEDRFGQGRP